MAPSVRGRAKPWEVGVNRRASNLRGGGEFEVQGLEPRMLLSGTALTVALTSGTLVVTGSNSDDQITITQDSTVWTIANGDWSTTKIGTVKKLVVNAGLGDDSITVDAGISVPATLSGGAGNDVEWAGS